MNKSFFTIIALLGLTTMSCGAGQYYMTAGTQTSVTFRGKTYTAGNGLLTSLSQLNGVEAGSTVYFGAGTWTDAVTLTVPNLTLMGANAGRDGRAASRVSPSVLSGCLTVAADGLTVNGFDFTGAGQVYNSTATTAAPLSGLRFVYNKVSSAGAIALYLGTAYTGTQAAVATAHCRYSNIAVDHNTFVGDANHTTGFVSMAGNFGTTSVSDNTFTAGGRSIALHNSQGTINVAHNNFNRVGDGIANGAFCIMLRYIAYSNSTTVNIAANDFNACQGETSLWPVIRLFNGDDSNPDLPVKNCKVNINYNVFRGKNKVAGTNYNYVFYTKAGFAADARFDVRHNRFDNSEYALGMTSTPWQTEAQRYFASSTGLFDFATSKGTTVDYYTNAKAVQLKAQTVAQSFDIDDKTGDIYFVQICKNSVSGLSLKSNEPLCVIRYYKNSSGSMAKQYMYLDMAGHGSNMAVTRKSGKVYIALGGNSKNLDDGGVASVNTCIFPFVAGATADLSKTSFTHSGTTYKNIIFDNGTTRTRPYPAIDNDNRLFAERQTASGTIYIAIYDLDDVLNNGSAAKVLKYVKLPKTGDRPSYTSSDSKCADIVKADQGFQTWDPQGFTISGDYLYFAEGVGESNSAAVTYPAGSGTKIPTIMLQAYNWRDGTYTYRKPVLKSLIISLVHGEPEGVKIHRDSKGRAHMLLGVATGLSGARRANIFDYTLDETNGLAGSIAQPAVTPGVTDATMRSTASVASPTLKVNYTVKSCSAKPQAALAGADADLFTITGDSYDPYTGAGYVNLQYVPGTTLGPHNAALRLSEPYGADAKVLLTGTNDNASAVADIAADALQTDAQPVYYNLQGIRIDNPIPGQIYLRRQGNKTQKIIL